MNVFDVTPSMFTFIAFRKLSFSNVGLLIYMIGRYFSADEDPYFNLNLFFSEITSVFYFMMLVIVNDTVSKNGQKDCFINAFNKKNDPDNFFKL